MFRHDKICKYVHWVLCADFDIPVAARWYDHVPEPVIYANSDVTILYNHLVHTDRCIPANRPDIIIKDMKSKRCLLIDVSVPADKNVISKEAEKRLKYRDLSIEISRMWQMKTYVVPVVVGALGAVSKNLGGYLLQLSCKLRWDEVQKTAVLGTAHILRKVLV